MTIQASFGRSFTVHKVEISLEGDDYLDDRLIIDATAPDGVRRSLSIRAWHSDVLTNMSEQEWKRMGASLLKIAFKVEMSAMIEGVKRDYGYL